jgi:hypothetical protein
MGQRFGVDIIQPTSLSGAPTASSKHILFLHNYYSKKCTSFLLLKAQDITVCTFVFVFLAPTCFNPRDIQQHSFNVSF